MPRVDFINQVAAFWGWLPAFRAVAETEHLPEAARVLRVAPSALSRSIRLLEDAVGRPLFDRGGGRLRLNDEGRALLAAVRDAMRLVHSGVTAMDGAEFAGPVVVGCEGDPVISIVARALTRVRRAQVGLVPRVLPLGDVCSEAHAGARRTSGANPGANLDASSGASSDVAHALLLGRVDVVVVAEAEASRGLEVQRLGPIAYSVYCGRGHPLFRRRAPKLADVLAHPFVAPPAREGARAGRRARDGWPTDLARRVAVELPSGAATTEVCARGELLAVLADDSVQRAAERGALKRIPLAELGPIDHHAVTRTRLAPSDRAGLVVDALRAEFRALERRAGCARPAEVGQDAG
jgi:DNA-binding transcriptional LysR family regulator